MPLAVFLVLSCIAGCAGGTPRFTVRITATDRALLDLPPVIPLRSAVVFRNASAEHVHQIAVVPVPATLGNRVWAAVRSGDHREVRRAIREAWEITPLAVLTALPGEESVDPDERAALVRPGWYLLIDPLPVGCTVRAGEPTCALDSFGRSGGPPSGLLNADRGVVGAVRAARRVIEPTDVSR